MAQDSGRISLNGAIEALLAEDTIDNRISNANRLIAEMEQSLFEIPDECLNHLKEIVGQLTHLRGIGTTDNCSDDQLSAEQELALTDALLCLYITTSGGSLIF
jgi:hypothetical protein